MKQYRQCYQLFVDKKRREKSPDMFQKTVEKMYDQFNFIKTERQIIQSNRTKNLNLTQQIYFMKEDSNLLELNHNQNKTKYYFRKKKEKLEIQPCPHTISIPPLLINMKQLNVKKGYQNRFFPTRRRFLTTTDQVEDNHQRNNPIELISQTQHFQINQTIPRRQVTFRSWSRKSSDNLSIKRQFQ